MINSRNFHQGNGVYFVPCTIRYISVKNNRETKCPEKKKNITLGFPIHRDIYCSLLIVLRILFRFQDNILFSRTTKKEKGSNRSNWREKPVNFDPLRHFVLIMYFFNDILIIIFDKSKRESYVQKCNKIRHYNGLICDTPKHFVLR